MRACLVPVDGGPPLEIVRDITLVGRKRFCDIRLEHPSVSKVHLLIVRTDGLLLIRDLGSTNGTHVNGQQVCRGALLPDDRLAIAACKFRVEISGEPDAVPEPSAAAGRGAPPVARVIRVDENQARDVPLPVPNRELLDTDRSSEDDSSSVELPRPDGDDRNPVPP